MNLGALSLSLNVKDIVASLDFYAKLGFSRIGGDQSQGWVILQNGSHVIGLFSGMFDKNILTFTPGWDSDGNDVDDFTDVRQLQRELRERGVVFVSEADETSTGPASFVIEDPDGNPILVDQHRSAP